MWLLIILVLIIGLVVLGIRSGFVTVKVNSDDQGATQNPRYGADDSTASYGITEFPETDFQGAYYDGMRDKNFISMERQYYALLEEIESNYSVATNTAAPDSDVYDKIEKKCLDTIVLFQMLVPLWDKYERGIPSSCPAYKRLAMIREKRGDYEGAALACVQQLRLGIDGDGTKGGMRGRLARMVKKGSLDITSPEAMNEISKYLEI